MLYDGHGSTRGLVDALGFPISSAEDGSSQPVIWLAYDAYGQALNFAAATALTTLLYSGEHLDSLTNLQYLRARWYDPSSGRFTRLDPFFGAQHDPVSLHKYLYAGGDPVNAVDPSGLYEGLTGLMARVASFANMVATYGGAVFRATWYATRTIYGNIWYQRMLVAYVLGSGVFSAVFWFRQGRLTGTIAALYGLRGLIGLTGWGLLVTHPTKRRAIQLSDDGVMMEHSTRERRKWMIDYALSQGAAVGAGQFTKITLDEFADTGLRPNVTASFWIGGLHKFYVKGEYEISVVRSTPLGHDAVIRNVKLHWAGTDVVDPHPPWSRVEENNPVLWGAESLVWVVGGLLGADFPIRIHAFEESDGPEDIVGLSSL